MRNYLIIFALVLLATPISQCEIIDEINHVGEVLYEFKQKNLKSGAASVEVWGNDSSQFYKCTNLSDKYFSTISNTFTLSKKFTNIDSHSYVKVSFDYVFLNIEKTRSAITKNAQITVDGVAQTFSASVASDDYGCMTHTSKSKVDGKNSATLIFTHSASSMTISIKPLDLGTVARLGVANMTITPMSCGVNSLYDSSLQKCFCNTGHVEKKFVGFNGTYLECA